MCLIWSKYDSNCAQIWDPWWIRVVNKYHVSRYLGVIINGGSLSLCSLATKLKSKDSPCVITYVYVLFLHWTMLGVNIEGGSLSLCQFATKLKQEGGG